MEPKERPTYLIGPRRGALSRAAVVNSCKVGALWKCDGGKIIPSLSPGMRPVDSAKRRACEASSWFPMTPERYCATRSGCGGQKQGWVENLASSIAEVRNQLVLQNVGHFNAQQRQAFIPTRTGFLAMKKSKKYPQAASYVNMGRGEQLQNRILTLIE